MAHVLAKMNIETSSNTNAAHAACELTAPDTVPDILYVMGTGRSGTTILEVLLTNSQGVEGTGELKHIFRDGFVRGVTCACGKPACECDLWSQVMEQGKWSRAESAELARMFEAAESHAHFPRVFFGAVSADVVDRYRDATGRILRAVRRGTGCSVVVDSSKYPSRALLLDRLFPGKVRVLCITRSARGLLAAFRKQNDGEQRPKSTWAASAYYLYVLLCMRLVRTKLKERCLVLRFEELSRDPDRVLEAIERWSGYSFANSRAKIAAGEWFRVGHIVTGNRLRKKGSVQFDPSSAKTSGTYGLVARVLEAYRNALGF